MAKKKQEESGIVTVGGGGGDLISDTFDTGMSGLSIPGLENGVLQKRVYDEATATQYKQQADDLKSKVPSTKKALKSIVSMVRSHGKVHEAWRNAQGDIAEVAADMSQSDAKAAKRIGKSAVKFVKAAGEAHGATTQAQQEIAALPSGNFSHCFKGL